MDKAIGLPTRRSHPRASPRVEVRARTPRVFTRARRSSRTPARRLSPARARPKPRPSTVDSEPLVGNVVMAFHAIVADASSSSRWRARASSPADPRPPPPVMVRHARPASVSSPASHHGRASRPPSRRGHAICARFRRRGDGARAGRRGGRGRGEHERGRRAAASRYRIRCAMRASTCPRCA